ncbi:hypothetical protein M422DRAFT_263866 [Sphaerobolus stellatus SS14]|uniref:Uncharacterized protein n=1 Tax=Sphaerobolus stellatus (strain SS14) TaxID=990650 RepID=A0A0C9V9U1_SPHS4|nr:hypothetical protein M422DRAFT_263866 [Sphaerobolus stellatus SS14]
MSHNCGNRRARAEELSATDIEDSEPTTGLTMGDLSNSPSPSVDPQQSPPMLPLEHPKDPHATAHGSQTAPSREQSPSRVGMRPCTATQGLSPSRLAGASGTAHRGSHTPPRVASITATQGHYSPRGITHRSESRSNSGQVSPTGGDTDEDFIIKASEVVVLRQEYSEFITLKDNAEIVLAEAMEATERLNMVFSRVRTSMSRMSPRMKELFSVPSNQASGKMLEPGNNWAHDKAAAKAATQRIIDHTAMIRPAPESGAEERARTTRSHVPGDRYSRAPLPRNIPEDIPHVARSEQGEDSQPRRGREAHTVYACDTPEARVRDTVHASPTNTRHDLVSVTTHDRPSLSANQVIQGIPESIEHSRHSIAKPQSIDMNALREEIKATISATIKEKLRSDADSVTTVSQSMQALDSNAQYWSNLSNKATRRSRRALELQLKLAEEKVNNLLHEEAPEEELLEAAQEAHSIHFQLDQSSQLCEAGLMPEQQVRFSANTGRNITNPSRNYGPNPIIEPHIPQSEMVNQALQNASLEDEPEKSFLAKAGIKMGTPPTYGGEHNLEKFRNWVASLLQFMLMYNLLGPRASKIQLQLLGQCLTDEAQEWFYQ